MKNTKINLIKYQDDFLKLLDTHGIVVSGNLKLTIINSKVKENT